MLRTMVLMVCLLAPVAALIVDRFALRGALGNWRAAFSAALVIYVTIVAGAMIQERHLDAKLREFDLDGDGMFSGSEITPEQELAMDRVTSDTGRTFAPFTGAVFAIAYTALSFGVVLAGGALVRRFRA